MEKSKKEEKEDPKKGKPVAVKVIHTVKDTQLVQWQEGKLPRRATVPLKESYTKDDLEQGVQYGVHWEEIELKADSNELALLLYQNDIWTTDDAARSTRMIIGLLAKVYGGDLATILRGGKNA